MEGAAATIKDVTEEVAPMKREVIAESVAMREVLSFVRKVASSEATTILLEGENGTGKDLVAKTLHYESPRQAEPFIAINCAAIPETLLESELFGYEKGAFTDARAQKRGLFELADKGTLFLDEIGEIPLTLQAKLLRVLEEQSFGRLGGLKEIPPLVEFFIDHYDRKFKRRIEGVSAQALDLLLAHDWPGNVRELRNALERAMILEESSLIGPVLARLGVFGYSRHLSRAFCISCAGAIRWKSASVIVGECSSRLQPGVTRWSVTSLWITVAATPACRPRNCCWRRLAPARPFMPPSICVPDRWRPMGSKCGSRPRRRWGRRGWPPSTSRSGSPAWKTRSTGRAFCAPRSRA